MVLNILPVQKSKWKLFMTQPNMLLNILPVQKSKWKLFMTQPNMLLKILRPKTYV